MSNYDYEFNEKIHATIINPYLSQEDFEINCELIKKYNIKNISTSLNYLGYLKDSISNLNAKINVFISYPLSDLPLRCIKDLISYAKDNGAEGIEYLPKFFLLSKNDENSFANDIDEILNQDIQVKLIFNHQKLDQKIFRKAINISTEIGVKNFQLGDGFGSPLNSQDISNLKKLFSSNSFIKVFGGIHKLNQVIELFDLEINFVGTSNFHNIFEEIKFK